ncbi:Ldh family oxidoreductase [Paraburkholderia sp. BL10I2N1]|uniref:Ldh family oxidoreductase n=1 Tax=unclassified Paraburkholderia TaxID=2615204 RepID=UPI0010E6734A|nr:Ldh family oxidoreductase [Paraburkholderia sp. BL10I2N1]TDN62355.1 ureidoglycolate dehydrogenase (NAD+) [Paraburkholderia sp. BL10I2N1]
MKINTTEAHGVAVAFLVRRGMSEEHARMVADHLIYAMLAGHAYAGLPRLIPMAERLRKTGTGGTIRTVKETDKSALIDGANVNGYVTSVMAMKKAMALAKASGVGIVGVNNSWFSGLLRYYVEPPANEGFISIHAANSTARVAPHGGADSLLGTNPIAFAFPGDPSPLVIDFATSQLMWGDVIYHGQLGKPLPPDCAVDPQGRRTTDPAAALAGAILGWGGARGFSVSLIVQALGILAGSDPIVGEAGKWGYLFMTINPELLMPLDEFKQRIGVLRSSIEGSRPIEGGGPVRVPGSATDARLAEGRARGWIEIEDEIYRRLTEE